MTGKLKTSYDNDPIMYGFFVGCVHWALGNETVLDEYRRQTGDGFQAPQNPFDQMIDKATGNDLAFIQRFSDWVELNLFGTPDDVYGKAGEA